jgi:uncharacterized protein YndB with AHSA1/START domain
MLLTLVLFPAAIIAVILLVAAFKPAEFRIVRSATLAASPAVIFPLINDFHQWKAWSPWEKMDPDAKSTFDGPPAGAGASLAWDGNKKVGAGRMTIEESRPVQYIRIRLEFYKPMPGTSTAEFILQPQAGHTTVTWSTSGKSNFIGRVFCLFLNMDKMIGGNMEQGFSGIKRLAEGAR